MTGAAGTCSVTERCVIAPRMTDSASPPHFCWMRREISSHPPVALELLEGQRRSERINESASGLGGLGAHTCPHSGCDGSE